MLGSLIERVFQSTPLMRGETHKILCTKNPRPISIHTLHARGYFFLGLRAGGSGNFKPHPSWAGTRNQISEKATPYPISIHSPHARGDEGMRRYGVELSISIHSPHARGDGNITRPLTPSCIFQSTPLMRGETPSGVR